MLHWCLLVLVEVDEWDAAGSIRGWFNCLSSAVKSRHRRWCGIDAQTARTLKPFK